MRWADTSCPVCRYCLESEGHVSHCTTCNAAADLWICLICGHIGCGRYRSGHANGHWKDTNHCYALELETQRVCVMHAMGCLKLVLADWRRYPSQPGCMLSKSCRFSRLGCSPASSQRRGAKTPLMAV